MVTRFYFFQQAMQALLGSQDMVQGLRDLFSVLADYMPIEAVTFDAYDAADKSIVVEHLVTCEGFFTIGQRVPLTPEAVAYVERYKDGGRVVHLDQGEYLAVVPRENLHRLECHLPFARRSYMAGPLHMDRGFLGTLVCISRSEAGFTARHAQLMEGLLPACSMAIATLFKLENMNEHNARMLRMQGKLRRELEVLAPDGMVGAQGGLCGVVEAVRRLGRLDTPVLILGETGTGKELVANAIQKLSARSDKPFIKVNCGALTDTLVDSELFGHEKGAFTGADRVRQGRFEQADGGTLFLDELGELSPQAQVRLLRVLQDGKVERIGSEKYLRVDVRIIAATNRDLAAMCRAGRFRDDLFHRLHVFPVHIPPLRRRREDIPLLVRHLASRTAARLGLPAPVVAMEKMDRLMQYAWPGNVRELENLVERALILSAGEVLDLTAFLEPDGQPPEIVPAHDLPSVNAQLWAREDATHDEPDAERIKAALQQCRGRVYGPHGAAALLGMNHNTLYSRLRKWGVKTRRVWET